MVTTVLDNILGLCWSANTVNYCMSTIYFFKVHVFFVFFESAFLFGHEICKA